MKRYIKSSFTSVSIDDIFEAIEETYEKLKTLSKPEETDYMCQHWGSSPIYTVVGNELRLYWDEPIDMFRKHAYVIKLGGAYSDRSIIDSFINYLWNNKNIIIENGYYIVDEQGSNYGLFGIVHK